jgi:ribosomal protein S27AE
MKDGHLNKCKSCTKKDSKNRYYNPIFIDKIREYERKRFKDKNRKKKLIIYQKRRRKIHNKKNRARVLVSRMIKKGLLTKEVCVKCGDVNSQAHHTDYRSPLKIIWLCFKCHRKEHGQRTY